MTNTHSLDLEKDNIHFAYVADSASLSITGDLTIELWVKVESAPSNDRYGLVGKSETSTTDISYILAYDDLNGTKRLRFFTSADGSTVNAIAVNHDLGTGTWHHIAAVYDASAGSVEFFVDGSSIGSASGLDTSLDDNSSKLNVGADRFDEPNSFDGKIDDVRIWNDKRTSSEISTNYKRELAGNEPNLQAYYKLNNSYDDETANNNDLTASGLPSFSTDVPFEDTTTTSTSSSTTTTSTSTTTTSTSTTTTSTSTTTTSTSITTTSTSTTTTSTTTTSTSTTTTSTTTTSTSTTTTLDLRFVVEKVK